jgi:hypothetical protein
VIENYPNDKSTIFSIVPFEVQEFKPGLYPGNFRIKACKDELKPERLVVGASEHLMASGGKKHPIRNITPSYQVASSLVRDFLDGQLFVSESCGPGICWVQGDVGITAFKTTTDYEQIKKNQKTWFVRVCQETDNDWKKYNSYRVVSDTARFACRFLGLDREWLKAEEVGFTYNRCPACSTMNNPGNAVCTVCRCVLDETKYSKLKFASGESGSRLGARQ